MKLALILVGVAVAVWLLGLGAVTWSHVRLTQTASTTSPAPAGAIICLGAGMASDTSTAPGPSSRRRAETCAALYAAGRAPLIIMTGEGHDIGSAAQAMADTAMAAGVPVDAIVVEPRSGSTIQNAAFSLPLLPDGTDRIILVSDGFHLPRARLIFRALGAPEITVHATPGVPLAQARRWIFRESVAWWFNLWRAGLYYGGGLLGIDQDRRIAWFD